MKKIAALFAVPLLALPISSVPGVALSQSMQGEVCAGIDNNTARLACYDVLFQEALKEEAAAPAAKTVVATTPALKPAPAAKKPALKKAKKTKKAVRSAGGWRINAGKVALDGSARVVIGVTSDQPIIDQAGQKRDAYIYAACRSEKVTLWVNFDQPLEVHPENVPVELKFDEGFTETVQMRNSYDWRSVGIWDDDESKKLLGRLEKAEKLSVKVRRRFGDEISAQFNIVKLSNALKPLQEACGWERNS